MVAEGIAELCMLDVVFPAKRRSIVYPAAGCGCPSDVIIALLDLPERTYLSMHDVLCTLGDPAFCP